eukprot:scaffold2251_cov73-Cyclotella_meneghiniana.AAC.10
MESPTDDDSRNVLTFVMTIEYNGFGYAGFQRQISTHKYHSNGLPTTDDTTSSGKRQRNAQAPRSNKTKTCKAPITIQQQLENALEQWTNLSVATLRLRGAGRTDKGVHASGQVVAFDVPLSLLGEHDCSPVNAGDTRYHGTHISKHALPLLQEAYQTYCRSSQNETKQKADENPSNDYIDFWQIRRAISTRLPSDIVIRTVWVWTGNFPFEARQGISSKTYTYKLRFRRLAFIDTNDDHGHDKSIHPICNSGPHLLRRITDQNSVWLCPWPLDETLLHSTCEAFVGLHDFHNFVHSEEHKKRTKCNNGGECSAKEYMTNLHSFDVDLEVEGRSESSTMPPVYNAIFTLKAKGFHRQMIRNLIGFVVDVCRGIQSPDNIPILLREDKSICEDAHLKRDNYTVNAAPACGLSLVNVKYERNFFMAE